MLELESRLVYSDRHSSTAPRIAVSVDANVFDPVTRVRENTNTFVFLFELDNEESNCSAIVDGDEELVVGAPILSGLGLRGSRRELARVEPSKYEEAMQYLSARRKVKAFDKAVREGESVLESAAASAEL